MAKKPIITIIGIPNTGKSTLFNRLIGQNKALVHNQAGMTRDIYKISLTINDKHYELQDSGGFFPQSDIITEEINKRIFKEAERSDLIIFLFDGRRELLDFEKELFIKIKKIKPDIISVINKVDNENSYLLPVSYYPLKEDYIYVSAAHNINIEDLEERIDKHFENYKPSSQEEESITRITILGKPNVGKSSIINRIMNDESAIVSPIAGTTRDSVDFEVKRKGKKFILVDNAGIRKFQKIKESTESAAVVRAEKDIRNADIIIFVLDISRKLDKNDMFIARKIIKSAKPVIVALNKWDLVKDKEFSQKLPGKVKKSLNSFYFSPFVVLSAESGKNIFEIIDKADEINKIMEKGIKKSVVIDHIRQITSEKKYFTQDNRIFNPKHAVVETIKPFFIQFSHKTDAKLKSFDEIYIKKRLSSELNLEGIPIFFNIKSSGKK